MRKYLKACVLALGVLSATSVVAQECVVEVQTALEQSRTNYINGMSGLASNNFSSRPGSYSSMACLDQFMQGGMDIFFRPPDLDSLLQQVLGFACDQIEEALGGMTGGAAGGGDFGLLKAFSGGLTVPAQGGGTTTVNMSDFVNYSISGGNSSALSSLFGGR